MCVCVCECSLMLYIVFLAKTVSSAILVNATFSLAKKTNKTKQKISAIAPGSSVHPGSNFILSQSKSSTG